MVIFQRIRRMVYNFLLKYHLLLIVLSIICAGTTGFFHYHFIYQKRDAIFWIKVVYKFYKQHNFVILLTISVFLVVTALVAGFRFAHNASPVQEFTILMQMRVRKRYSNFLFRRLVSEIREIEERELKGKEVIELDDFMKAREEIDNAIAKFRRDGRKLLFPNELEMSLPMEDVYAVGSETIDERFAHIEITEEELQELITA